MAESRGQHLQENLNIDKEIIHNLANLLYSNGNRSCFGHPLWDLSQDLFSLEDSGCERL